MTKPRTVFCAGLFVVLSEAIGHNEPRPVELPLFLSHRLELDTRSRCVTLGESMSVHWYRLEPDDVLSALDSDATGLSEEHAAHRLTEYGANEIAFQPTPWWVRLLRQFHDPMVYVLLVTAVITTVLTVLGEPMLPDTVVIVGVVLLNALLGLVQESKAEGALEALRSMMVPECLVERGGCQRRLPARELVPGDIVLLESGDKIPADIRFLSIHNVHVDESSLTGESVPIAKACAAICSENLVPGDQRNMGFSGTYLTRGTARAVVVATGRETLFGHIAQLVQSSGAKVSPLQRKLKAFVRSLIIAIVAVGVINFGVGVYLGYAIAYSFLGAVSLVVAAIPEMLPALVTSILALSATIMATRKALVRHLPAAETLGATSVICSDKTGTLTENRMTVTRLYSAGRMLSVTGAGTALTGQFLRADGSVVDVNTDPAVLRLLHCGFHCNNARVSTEHSTGDPTELALRIAGLKGGIGTDGLNRLVEIPFESSTKYMAVLVSDEQQRYLLVKGAPEIVAGMCSQTLDEQGHSVAFDQEQLQDTVSEFAREALRTLGFAMKYVPSDQQDLTHTDLTGLTFLGLQGLIDPPKASAIDAVAQCRRAGIRTVMITGDHPDTARAVADQLGIAAGRAVTGAELSMMDADTLDSAVRSFSVFARVSPEHKQQIAQTLQQQGHVVAMTGDGVNDAPALKQADIGVAMGVTGTEVAKEAADMVLADDNFATIVDAVEEGRHAWNNLQKAILYTLPTNAAQALLIMGAIMMAAFVPLFAARFVLEPVQILWVNLLDSFLLTMPLMMEAKERDLLASPPRDPRINIVTPLFVQRVVVMGLAIAVPTFFLYYFLAADAVSADGTVDQMRLTQAQTAAFWSILVAHIGYALSARSIYRSVFTLNPFGNRWLMAGIGLSLLIRFVPTVYPAASELFRTAPFPPTWWPLILSCMVPSLAAIELDKWLRRRGWLRV